MSIRRSDHDGWSITIISEDQAQRIFDLLTPVNGIAGPMTIKSRAGLLFDTAAKQEKPKRQRIRL
jgi:hypothetical protein